MKTIGLLQQILPGYEFISLIGQGLGGETWLAHGPQGMVAVKVLSQRKVRTGPAFAQMLGEAMVLATVKHPHVVPYLAFAHDSAQGVAALVMRYISGGDLEQYIAQVGPFPSRAVASLGLTLVSALESLHEAGYIHRDLKPRNILVERVEGGPPVLYVADFGISQPLVDGVAQARFRALTPGYAAPEQWVTVHLGQSVDVYALGAVLWFMFTGHHPGQDDELPGPEAITEGDASRRFDDEADRALCHLLAEMMSEQSGKRPDLTAVQARLGVISRMEEPDRGWSTVVISVEEAAANARPAPCPNGMTVSLELDGEPYSKPGAETRELFEASTVVKCVPEAVPPAARDAMQRHPQAADPAEREGWIETPGAQRLFVAVTMTAAALSVLLGGLSLFFWSKGSQPGEEGAMTSLALEESPIPTPPEPVPTEEIVIDAGPVFEYADPPASTAPGTVGEAATPSSRKQGQQTKAATASEGVRSIAPPPAEAAPSPVDVVPPTKVVFLSSTGTGASSTAQVQQPGRLSVNVSRGWADVWIDGTKIEDTPLYNYEIGAGTYTVRVVNPSTGLDVSKQVRILPGRTEKVYFQVD